MPLNKHPAAGQRRWSTFFGQNIELVSYLGDRDWWFRLPGRLDAPPLRARTSWSRMPEPKEIDDER
jgi:carbonic anhydrase